MIVFAAKRDCCDFDEPIGVYSTLRKAQEACERHRAWAYYTRPGSIMVWNEAGKDAYRLHKFGTDREFFIEEYELDTDVAIDGGTV